MKLYYSPGACSIGIHVLLEEIGKPYEAEKVALRDGAQHSSDYKAVNPKSKVPALLRDDGSTLTELPAIAFWLARTNPQSHLLPEDIEGQARVLEAMDYVVATIHMQGFSRMFRAANFAPNEADHPAVKARGREIIDNAFAVMDRALAGRDYLAGAFSIADAALFFVEYWGGDLFKLDLPPNVAAHLARMKARPAVQRVLKAEGLAS